MNIQKTVKIVVLSLLALLVPLFAHAQTALSSTTLSAAVNGPAGSGSIGGSVQNTIQLTSTTNIIARQSMIYVDNELMSVQAVPTSGLVQVTRGAEGTRASSHASGATVYFSTGTGGNIIAQNLSQTASAFIKLDPSGSCTSTLLQVLPVINVNNARRWNCIGSVWMVDDGLVVLGPGGCGSGESGNATGTNGLTVTGASFIGTIQAQTSASGTNTHYYSCNLNNIMSALTASPTRNVAVIDATFFYGVQTTELGTQATTLASGTLNSITVFSKIAMPAAGTSETPSTVTPVRADSGTMALLPAVANFNVATTTAGAFYSEKVTPGAPVFLTTDGTQYFFNVALLNTATSATITNSPGVLVHYAYIPD